MDCTVTDHVCKYHSGIERVVRIFMGVAAASLAIMVPLIAGFLVYVARLDTMVRMTAYITEENKAALEKIVNRINEIERMIQQVTRGQ